VHFLKPTSAIEGFDPTHYLAGLEWLSKTLFSVLQPSFLLTDGLGLFAAGCLLAWVRYRTRSLALTMGLHAGWILAFKGFRHVVEDGASHGLSAWILGANPRLGLLPLAVLGITALGCYGLMKRFEGVNRA
jgi:membrane protease YdiL (CAAX protease family)